MSRSHFFLGACASALAACFAPNSGDAEPQPAPGGDAPALAPSAAANAPSGPAFRVERPEAPAADSARIVFAAKMGASLDLFTVLPDGSDVRQLTDTPDEDEMFPHWSPDHARIAYVSGAKLFVMDPDGTTRAIATEVGRDGYGVSAPAWSPDGASLLYPHARDAKQGGATLLHRVSADGASDATFTADMTSVGATLTEPTWFGDSITFLRTSECGHCAGGASIVTVDDAGSQRAALDLEGHGLDVAPDGRWAFTTPATPTASGYEYPGTIFVALPGGALAKSITANDAWMPRWSPSGGHIAFLRADGIYVATSKGEDATRIFTKSGVRGFDW
ncbi:MAG TPA: hypothetical protein VIF62_19590 [Labilithrix sp.]